MFFCESFWLIKIYNMKHSKLDIDVKLLFVHIRKTVSIYSFLSLDISKTEMFLKKKNPGFDIKAFFNLKQKISLEK